MLAKEQRDEEEECRDTAGEKHDLRSEQELGPELQEDAGDSQKRDQETDRRMNGIAARNHGTRTDNSDGAKKEEQHAIEHRSALFPAFENRPQRSAARRALGGIGQHPRSKRCQRWPPATGSRHLTQTTWRPQRRRC